MSSNETLQAVRGMNDILPDEAGLWLWFEEVVRDWLHSYGYRNIRMPLAEPTALFKRAIDEVTDIVEQEMYSFDDALNGDHLTLRPEGTASCVRAVLQHNLLYNAPQRLYYSGQMFRHERPQKGRYRQFHQFGVEALGFAGPDIDAEQILMCARLWKKLGLRGQAFSTAARTSKSVRHRCPARRNPTLQPRIDETGGSVLSAAAHGETFARCNTSAAARYTANCAAARHAHKRLFPPGAASAGRHSTHPQSCTSLFQRCRSPRRWRGGSRRSARPAASGGCDSHSCAAKRPPLPRTLPAALPRPA